MTTLVIVKLGGSQSRLSSLLPWLRAIEGAAGRVVLVPGGGPFADAVRAAQAAMGFDDRAAHEMALLAMAQLGEALTSLGRGLLMAGTEDAIAKALAAGHVPVWSPAPMLSRRDDVPASWEVTSDSLALWLASRLGARSVLLVKPRAVPAGLGPAALAREGVVDAAFPRFLAAYGGTVFVAGPEDVPGGPLDPDRLPGRPLGVA